MNILIAGDSFAADWRSVSTEYPAWWELLANDYNITNVAQAGVSEYKILKQLQQCNSLDYDLVIVSHTGFSRVHTRQHPLHKTLLHKNCDLLLNDIDRVSWFNESLKSAKLWFKHHYDDEYQKDIYRLLRKEIQEQITVPYISISHLFDLQEFVIENVHFNFENLWKNNRGIINHYNQYGNKVIYTIIKNHIDQGEHSEIYC